MVAATAGRCFPQRAAPSVREDSREARNLRGRFGITHGAQKSGCARSAAGLGETAVRLRSLIRAVRALPLQKTCCLSVTTGLRSPSPGILRLGSRRSFRGASRAPVESDELSLRRDSIALFAWYRGTPEELDEECQPCLRATPVGESPPTHLRNTDKASHYLFAVRHASASRSRRSKGGPVRQTGVAGAT